MWGIIALTYDCRGGVLKLLSRDLRALRRCPVAVPDRYRRELFFRRARTRVRGSVWVPASAGVCSSKVAASLRFLQRKCQRCAKRVTVMCCERRRHNLFGTAHMRCSVGAPGAPAASSGAPPGPQAPGAAPEPVRIPLPLPIREADVLQNGQWIKVLNVGMTGDPVVWPDSLMKDPHTLDDAADGVCQKSKKTHKETPL